VNKLSICTAESAQCDHFGPTKSDDINLMITITNDFYLSVYSKWGL